MGRQLRWQVVQPRKDLQVDTLLFNKMLLNKFSVINIDFIDWFSFCLVVVVFIPFSLPLKVVTGKY